MKRNILCIAIGLITLIPAMGQTLGTAGDDGLNAVTPVRTPLENAKNYSGTQIVPKAYYSSGAIQLDGIDDYMHTPFNDYDFSNFTMECWMNAATFSANVHFISLYQSSYLIIGDWANIDTWAQGLNPVNLGVNVTPEVDKWNHMAFVFDGTIQYFYLNGVLIDSATSTGSLVVNNSGYSEGLVIGARYNRIQQFTNCKFADVRIWNAARSQSEIRSAMTSRLNGDESGLLAYYVFDEGTGVDTVADLSGNGNTLTLYNMETTDWIDAPYFSTDTEIACDSFTWTDGISYTQDTSSIQHLVATNGADSIATLDLTIEQSSVGTDIITACNSYTWIDGITYTESNNIASDTLQTIFGCDSVVTLDLTINSVSDITTSTEGATITANNASASYQWLDCNDSYAVIDGETSASFTGADGSYAVELTENDCVDTSACVTINTVSLDEHSLSDMRIYPNPAKDQLTLEFDQAAIDKIMIFDAQGRMIQTFGKIESSPQVLDLNLESGLYLVRFYTDEQVEEVRLLIE